MREDTTNSLLQPFTHSSNNGRLIVVTGKGGVGKTTLSMALTSSLHKSGKNVLYNCFDHPINKNLINGLDLPYFNLEMGSSAREYIAKKLHSETIAGWIFKTPFFNSLFNMLPGLGHMILIGHIINKLEEDPSLTIVLDSPSSGHVLTMLESPMNFKEMFKTGLIVDDIKRMEDFIYNENLLEVIITSLPTKMAIQEAVDLERGLNERKIDKIQFVINDVLKESPSIKTINKIHYPTFLKKKIEIEDEVFNELKGSISWRYLPHFSHKDASQVIQKASNFILEENNDFL